MSNETNSKIATLTAERDEARGTVEKLAAFKAYVHKRLDDAGVPTDPESTHKVEGCRVGGRLDFVQQQIKELEGQLSKASHNARFYASKVEGMEGQVATLTELLGRLHKTVMYGHGYMKLSNEVERALAALAASKKNQTNEQ